MLRRMKDMKDMVNAAPGMIEQAQQVSAQAQQMAVAQQAAAHAQVAQAQMAQAQMAQAQQLGQFGGLPSTQPALAATGADLEPIAGVSLEEFAAICKGIAAYNYDQSKLPEIAASRGISAFNWDDATRGWNGRIRVSPAVAQRFNQLYRES